jgi:putative membrane protein insertion efficiency factor
MSDSQRHLAGAAPSLAPKVRDSVATPSVRGLLSLPAQAASGLIWIYQQVVSPALVALNPTCGCRFAPTCSHYARAALREHGLVFGIFFSLRRLAKCGPWHPGGEDPVPARGRPVCTRISPA